MSCVWHDLRKNPKDLPAESMLCVILYENEYHKHVYTVTPYRSDVQVFVTYKRVLAWTKLDEFNEQENA